MDLPKRNIPKNTVSDDGTVYGDRAQPPLSPNRSDTLALTSPSPSTLGSNVQKQKYTPRTCSPLAHVHSLSDPFATRPVRDIPKESSKPTSPSTAPGSPHLNIAAPLCGLGTGQPRGDSCARAGERVSEPATAQTDDPTGGPTFVLARLYRFNERASERVRRDTDVGLPRRSLQ